MFILLFFFKAILLTYSLDIYIRPYSSSFDCSSPPAYYPACDGSASVPYDNLQTAFAIGLANGATTLNFYLIANYGVPFILASDPLRSSTISLFSSFQGINWTLINLMKFRKCDHQRRGHFGFHVHDQKGRNCFDLAPEWDHLFQCQRGTHNCRCHSAGGRHACWKCGLQW